MNMDWIIFSTKAAALHLLTKATQVSGTNSLFSSNPAHFGLPSGKSTTLWG